MLVIAGTQRSGSSVLSRFCQKLGFAMGTTFWHEDIDGGLESPDICNHFSLTLGDPGFPWKDFREQMGRTTFHDFNKLETVYQVQKFSFLLMNPKFVRIWLRSRGLKHDRFLLLLRKPGDVIASKSVTEERRKRFSTDSALLTFTPEELAINVKQSVGLLSDFGQRVNAMNFPEFLTDYESVYRSLTDFGGLVIDKEGGRVIWDKMINLSKVHHYEEENQL